MKHADILIKNAYLLTLNESRTVSDNAVIAVEKDRIAAVGGKELLSEYQADRTIDAKGRVVLPGFISTHSHLFQTLLKGLGRDKDLLDWLNSSVRVALHNYNHEMIYYAAMCGCIEAIHSGTTSILDFMYAHSKPGFDEEVLRAFDDVGIRGMLGRAFTNVAAFPPEIACSYVETEQEWLDSVRKLEKDVRGSSRLSVAVAPGVVWDVTDDGYREVRRIADEFKMPITMHIVETPDDDAYSMETWGENTIPHMDRLGVLGPDFLGVHCVNMSEEDFALFKQHDVKISYNPSSNMILASGIAPIDRFVEEGLTVSLACDGSASNDSQDFLKELKLASLLQKVGTRNPKVIPAETALEMATRGGASAIGKADELGSIEVGKKADLIFFNPNALYTLPAYDPVAALVYSAVPSSIESVMIDGNMVLDEGTITTVDEEKMLYEAHKAGCELVSSSGLGGTQWGQKLTFPNL